MWPTKLNSSLITIPGPISSGVYIYSVQANLEFGLLKLYTTSSRFYYHHRSRLPGLFHSTFPSHYSHIL